MTVFKSILVFLLIGVYGFMNYESTITLEKQVSKSAKILNELQGTWTHSEDSSASVEISKDIWIFMYEGESIQSDSYNITITDSLPKYIDSTIDSELLILTGQTDTLEYEILGLNDTILSLMYFPRGDMHVYKKERK